MKNILTISNTFLDKFQTDIVRIYNKNIEDIFQLSTDNNNNCNNCNNNDNNCNNNEIDPTKTRLLKIIKRDISWGRNIEYFIVILRNSICRLNSQQPYITSTLLLECFDQTVNILILLFILIL